MYACLNQLGAWTFPDKFTKFMISNAGETVDLDEYTCNGAESVNLKETLLNLYGIFDLHGREACAAEMQEALTRIGMG